MKKFIKKHWLILSAFLVIFLIIFKTSNDFLDKINNYQEEKKQMLIECEKTMQSSSDLNYIKYCKELNENKNLKIDFFTMLTDLIVFELRFLNYIAFIIVMIPTTIHLTKILKNKYILNSITRESYNSFLKKYFKVAYKYIWVLPLIGIAIIINCLLNTTLDASYAEIYGSSIYSVAVMKHPIQFMICYILNITIYTAIFINLTLLVVRKKHNLITSIILAIIIYIGIELFFEVGINSILCGLVFKNEIGYLFNLINPFTFSDKQLEIFTLMLFTISIFTFSSILVHFAYKDKEKFIISCEKNN